MRTPQCEAGRTTRAMWFCVILMAMAGWGLGFHRHLGPYPADNPETFFGDAGDGLFNLWVLEHAANHAGKGMEVLSDGKIFWPEHADSYWWSDNLLVPSLLFRMVRVYLQDRFAAYWVCALMYSAGFMAFFVCSCRKCGTRNGIGGMLRRSGPAC